VPTLDPTKASSIFLRVSRLSRSLFAVPIANRDSYFFSGYSDIPDAFTSSFHAGPSAHIRRTRRSGSSGRSRCLHLTQEDANALNKQYSKLLFGEMWIKLHNNYLLLIHRPKF
jgi:hypothetical protein